MKCALARRDFVPCRGENFEMFKVLVTTKYRDRIVNYAQTFRELVVNSSGRCGKCVNYAQTMRKVFVNSSYQPVPMCGSRLDRSAKFGIVGCFSLVDWTLRWEVMTENVFNGSFQIKEVKLGHTGSG